jgi:hypothetical protein
MLKQRIDHDRTAKMTTASGFEFIAESQGGPSSSTIIIVIIIGIILLLFLIRLSPTTDSIRC